MLIVLSIYAAFSYLVFVRFKLLPWNRFWKLTTGFGGFLIALTVLGLLNFLTPTGRVSVQGVSVEITPNLSGTVTDVMVEPNTPIAKGTPLFKLDGTPFETEVARLSAVLSEAEAGEKALQSELDAVDAEIVRIQVQLDFLGQRRADIEALTNRGVSAEFQMQEVTADKQQLLAGMDAAKARKRGTQARIDAEVDGVTSVVAQAQQALIAAEWQLAQTTVYAPADGVVTALTLRPGQRVTTLRPAMVFVPNESLSLIGVFEQNGAHAFDEGTEVLVAMQALPGQQFVATVDSLPPGTGEGSLGGATGALPNLRQLRGANQFALRLELPTDLPEHARRMGMAGHAMTITENAGPIEPLARALFWVRTQLNFI